MGFGDFLKSALYAIAEGAERKVTQYNTQLEKNESLSDREVYNKYKNSSGTTKAAAAATLRDRGYGNKNN